MYGKILSADVKGMDGYLVTVEADISDGMPMFLMVGYLSSEVREASDRVRTALRNCGISLPPKRITVNLAPARLRKAGSKFDLPIAVALLKAMGYLGDQVLDQILIVGELRLNGEIHSVPGVLPMVENALKLGCRYCIVPRENQKEASMVPGACVLGVTHLRELLEILLEGKILKKTDEAKARLDEQCLESSCAYPVDFAEICGQESVKRAAQVAVAGMHHFAMIGPPGAGKTMIARRIPTILPPLSQEESLEISRIYSIAGLLSEKEPYVLQRPFRAPHHTASASALVGGGRFPLPGDVSLATNGVLFLDEFPEFRREVLEVLRQPLEEKEVRISRNSGVYVFPAKFMLVAAMNPCKCGFFPDMNVCTCSPGDVNRYLGKLSQPLLDRIDICVETPRMSYGELTGEKKGERSAEIRERMICVHQIQKERYKGTDYRFNGDLNVAGLDLFCPLGKAEKEFMEQVYKRLRLSARGYHKLIKVARTIADMEEKVAIGQEHLMEAVCYRGLDKKYGMR